MLRQKNSFYGSSKPSFAVVNIVNTKKHYAMNKDLCGFGTADDHSNTVFEKIIGSFKKRMVKLPIISLAFLMGIFKARGIRATYFEGTLPQEEFTVILIFGSIVDYTHENKVCRELKERFPHSRIGFIGPFPSTMPELFTNADFIIKGDFEKYFLNIFADIAELRDVITVHGNVDMDSLPRPELEGFPIRSYNYYPAITRRPFFTLQSSKGCPFSCSYYCLYPHFQGSKINLRSPKKVVGDMHYLYTKFGIRGFQFRDPVFGLTPGYIEEFCAELRKHRLPLQWGIETRLSILDEKKILMMRDVGLCNINVGMETINAKVGIHNKRVINCSPRDESLIRFAEKNGITIAAFYIFGYDTDTKESMRATLTYAKTLNTTLAKFSIFTPYPGTPLFADMKKSNRILTYDYETYNLLSPVIRHPDLNPKDISEMLSLAFREYYFRPRYVTTFLKSRVRRLRKTLHRQMKEKS